MLGSPQTLQLNPALPSRRGLPTTAQTAAFCVAVQGMLVTQILQRQNEVLSGATACCA